MFSEIWGPQEFYHRFMYIAPSSDHLLLTVIPPFKVILRRFEVVFWCLEWDHQCTFWKDQGKLIQIHQYYTIMVSIISAGLSRAWHATVRGARQHAHVQRAPATQPQDHGRRGHQRWRPQQQQQRAQGPQRRRCGKDMFHNISSVENQKGVIAVQRCSVENQKGAIAVQSLWH